MVSFNYLMILLQFQIFKIKSSISWKNFKHYQQILIYIYINKINNRLAFKIKVGYKIESQTPKTIKWFGSTDIKTDKTNNKENVWRLDAVKIVLVQCDLVENQYQKSRKCYILFIPNKS